MRLHVERVRRRTLPVLLALLLVVTSKCFAVDDAPASGNDKPWRVRSYQLYYGGSPQVLKTLERRIRPHQLIIIDLRSLTKDQSSRLITLAKKKDARVVAYLSVGEVHRSQRDEFRKFVNANSRVAATQAAAVTQVVNGVILDRNDRFDSWRVDVKSELWQEYLMDQARQSYARDVDGLFLDTVDTVDHFISRKDWSLDRRIASVEAMMNLIRDFKFKHPEKIIVQNRGLNLIGKEVFVGDGKGKLIRGLELASSHKSNPDVIMYENAFASSDDWSKAREGELTNIAAGERVQVIALGYASNLKDRAKFWHLCRESRFVPGWANSSDRLHKELTVSGPR